MHTTSLLLLLVAAGAVAVLHSILPDHWIPLAVVARSNNWSLLRVARVSAAASAGHVVVSLVLGVIIASIGLAFRQQIETQQGHIIGALLFLTGVGFLGWSMIGSRNGHGHSHDHEHAHDHDHTHGLDHADHHQVGVDHDLASQPHGKADHDHAPRTPVHDAHGDRAHGGAPARGMTGGLAALAVPFGVAASPDLTILPVLLAAGAVGLGAIGGVLLVFSALTIGTFVALTLLATLAGYQIKGEWVERHATSISAVVLLAIGAVAFIGL